MANWRKYNDFKESWNVLFQYTLGFFWFWFLFNNINNNNKLGRRKYLLKGRKRQI